MKDKIKILHDWFIPWIFEEYKEHELIEAWGSGMSIEDYALGIFGMLPVNHIANWEEIKHHYDGNDINDPENKDEIELVEGFESWSDYYEDDGYVDFIPDTLEVEWVHEEEEEEVV